jgi:hypothetical protein
MSRKSCQSARDKSNPERRSPSGSSYRRAPSLTVAPQRAIRDLKGTPDDVARRRFSSTTMLRLGEAEGLTKALRRILCGYGLAAA